MLARSPGWRALMLRTSGPSMTRLVTEAKAVSAVRAAATRVMAPVVPGARRVVWFLHESN